MEEQKYDDKLNEGDIVTSEKIEKELTKSIEEEEKKLTKGQKDAARRLFKEGFSEFWNGISSGWD